MISIKMSFIPWVTFVNIKNKISELITNFPINIVIIKSPLGICTTITIKIGLKS